MKVEATILVVEDDHVIAQDICQALGDLGYEVPRTVATGAQAFQQAVRLKPDLILMDIKLKGEADGIAAAAEIRRRLGIPIVYVTSHSDDATLARAAETNPYGYLIKPFDERDLRATIEIALQKRKFEGQLQARERWFATTLDSIGEAVLATNPSGIITFMNTLGSRVTGWKRSDAIGKEIDEVIRLADVDGKPVDNPVYLALREPRIDRAPYKTSMLLSNAGARVVDHSASPIVDHEGLIAGGLLVMRDVTDRTKLERRLEQRERSASIGAMAGEMGRVINSPLACAIDNVGFALRGLKDLIGSLHGLKVADEDTARHGNMIVRLEEVGKALLDAHDGADQMRRIVLGLNKFVPANADGTERATSADLPTAKQSSVPRRGRVLVIDDEETVGSVANILGSELEITVETDARAALARIACGETYDAILCDLNTPNISGIDVYRALVASDPETAGRIVFMTSAAFSALARPFLDKVPNASICKPFTPDSIRSVLTGLVDGP